MLGFFRFAFGNVYVREAAIVLLAVMLLILTEVLLTPQMKNVRYQYAGLPYSAESMPLAVTVKPAYQTLEAWGTLEIFPLQSTHFTVIGDDCLAQLNVNGVRVINTSECKYNQHDPILELGPYLHPGVNDIHIVARDIRGQKIGFSFIASSTRPLIQILRFLIALFPVVWLGTIVHRTIGRTMPEIAEIMYVGLILRLLYMFITPYAVRGYDTSAHIQYIEFVTEHWSVPLASRGWQFHQGPLYYFFTAPLLYISMLFDNTKMIGMQLIQNTSMMMSCLSVFGIAWCGTILFSPTTERRSLFLFTAFVALFPGTLMFASRISNDVLYHLIAITFLGTLLYWWRNGKTRWLSLSAFVIGLGFLTKANTYLFLPILWICAIFRPNTSLTLRIRWIAISGIIVTMMSGWLLAKRYQERDFLRLMAPGNGMHQTLNVATTPATFLTFNPFDIISKPYFNPYDDSSGRQYFWMSFFKTSLFGEFSYPTKMILLSRILATLLLGCVLMSFIGIVQSIRRQEDFLIPLLVTLIIIVEGSIGYRALHASASNQDFRFSILVLPVLAFFAIKGAESQGFIGQLMRAWLQAFVVVATFFFLALMVIK